MITWTGTEILEQARFANGSFGDGVVMSADEVADDLIALNMLLASWDVVLYATTQETFNTVASDASYSWGTAGDITTARPVELLDQTFIRSGTTDYQVRLIRQSEYSSISNKSATGLPDKIYFDNNLSFAYLYFHPTPDAVYAVYVTSVKSITEITDATQAVTIPPELAAALKWNMAIELAPNYSVPVTQTMATRAMQTKSVVMNRAFKYKMAHAAIDNVEGRNRGSSKSGSILGW